MKNIIGNNLTFTLFGESHGSKIGVVIDGLCAGIKIDYDFINECLNKRRPSSTYETGRIEKDNYEIISGVFNGYTTGTSIAILVNNDNVKSNDYDAIKDLARPSHVDYVANVKYHGYQDYRGGGHFSGRITAPLVIAGAILLKALEKFNIKIATHIKQIGNVKDVDFSLFEEEVDKLNKMDFPVISNIKNQMEEEISLARDNFDSIGGIIQTAIINLPVGLGEPLFSSLESEISRAMFSIGAIKGIEFGSGFNFASLKGSEANDEFLIKDNKVITKTNHNGGINGGISNGMPVLFNVVVKPTPSIYKQQNTINMKDLTNTTIKINGRHDPAIVRRINIVIRAMSAFVIADMLITKYGVDVFNKDKLD